METYKQFKLRVLRGLYKPYMDIKMWKDTDMYTDFVSKYTILEDAIISLKDSEPHVWIRCAINDFFASWTYDMTQLIEANIAI